MLELGNEKKARCLEVKVGGRVHAVPLAANMPIPFAKRMREVGADDEAATGFLFEYFAAYMGEDFDLLDMEDFMALSAEWSRLSKEGGVSAGESQASSE